MSSQDFNPKKDWVYYSGMFEEAQTRRAGAETLLQGKWIPSGEKVRDFERAFSKRFEFKESLMVNSGSSANLIMLAALKKYFEWPDGHRIVVSPVGFPTTIAPIVQNNLKPVFVDITFDDLNFDLDLVEKEKKGTIFLSPVLGNPPDMTRLPFHILDGCDSLGTKWDQKPLSFNSYAASCSFYPAHHISTGEGGMVSSDFKDLIRIARQFAWWGRDCYCVGSANQLSNGTCNKRFGDWLGDGSITDHKYIFTQMGYNVKPLDCQGSMGSYQLNRFDLIHLRRRLFKSKIDAMFLEHIPGIKTVKENSRAETSWFGVPIICDTPELKTELVKHLEKNHIQTRNYFAGNILKHPGYKHLGDFRNYPNANKVLTHVFFIGCHPGLTDAMLEHIKITLKTFDSSSLK